MRALTTALVLTALALVQVPLFTCESDCRTASLPVWGLTSHDCHCDHAPEPDPDLGHDGPGDHDLVFQHAGTLASSSTPVLRLEVLCAVIGTIAREPAPLAQALSEVCVAWPPGPRTQENVPLIL